jgi:hypothetical protein
MVLGREALKQGTKPGPLLADAGAVDISVQTLMSTARCGRKLLSGVTIRRFG